MKQKKQRLYIKTLWGIMSFFVCVVIVFGIFFIINNSVHRPIIQQPPIEHLENNQQTLLSQYTLLDKHPDYNAMIYRPRAFTNQLQLDKQTLITNAGIYRGWDVLTTPNVGQKLKLTFTRTVTLGIVLRNKKVPAWLATWQQEKQVSINGMDYPVYKKIISDSSFALDTAGSPLILFAERNGIGSKPPSFPNGQSEPKPNQTCPTWVHEEYKALAPDGKLYPTWHPQIDPVYWCYFNHEHGSNPSNFDANYRIPFGYAGNAMGMHEAHVGYKVYVWDDNNGYRFLALQHQGTATNQAACGNTHELDIVTKDKKNDEIVSEQYFVGDYGLSRPLLSPDTIKPSKCPNQSAIAKGNSGIRFLPVKDHGAIMEESWIVDSHNIVGFNFADFTVTTYDPARMCQDITCDSIVSTGQSGSNHTLGYVKGFGPKSGDGHDGIYYTDPMDKKIVAKEDTEDMMGAIRQYIKPGLSISSNIPYTSTEEANCRDIYGTGDIMQCGKGLTSVSSMRENSIKIPN